MNFSFFIANRFFRNSDPENKLRASNPAVQIATAGVAIGLAVMIVSLSVILGFKQEISDKMTGIGAHVEVIDVKSLVSPEDYPISANRAFVAKVKEVAGVRSVDKVAMKMGILKTNTDFCGITLKGLPAKYDTTYLAGTVTAGKLPAPGDAEGKGIAISRMQADKLHLKVGDKVFAYFFETTIKMRRFTVEAIYETHMGLFDKNLAFTSFNTVSQLNKWNEDQCSALEIRMNDFSKVDEAGKRIAQICKETNVAGDSARTALTIKEHYPQVFSWLELLDFNMVVILVLMVCLAGFTMISGLFILILERTNTIGILKALGGTNGAIRKIFLHLAALIIIRGLIIGNVIAFALLFVQHQWGIVHLDAATYYVDTVPICMNWGYVLLLNIGTLLLTVAALVGPSYMVSCIQPAKAIRFD